MVAETPHFRAFVSGAIRWCRTGAQAELARLIRSSCSGVPHDIGAAYAAVAARGEPLLDAIAAARLALPPADRDAVLGFAERIRRVRTLAQSLEDEPLRDAIAATFDLTSPTPARAPSDRSDPSLGDREIELTEGIASERPAGLHARTKHFSASALNAYAECARKWFYRYACAAIEDRGSSASAYGTAFHLALEDFHGEFPRPQRGDEARMRAAIVEYVRWAFERNRDGFETQVEFVLQGRRAQRTAQRYVDWLLVQERTAPFEVIGREVPANLDLDGHAFIGFIDRLDRDVRTGGVGVVDYKTGSIAASAAEYREKIRAFRDFQLPFYYWARTAQGDRVTSLALVPLKDALLDVRPIVLEVVAVAASAPPRGRGGERSPAGTISVSDLERARRRMIEVCDELAAGTIERFAVTEDPSACTYCAYATACAHKPPPAQERFGR